MIIRGENHSKPGEGREISENFSCRISFGMDIAPVNQNRGKIILAKNRLSPLWWKNLH
jgi:hypothetical protein